MTPRAQKIVDRLKAKAASNWGDKKRIPSLTDIAFVLDELGIPYSMRDSENIVEYRSAGNRYVNSRHRGKQGKKLELPAHKIFMDTSDSYYSHNSWHYAKDLLDVIKQHKGCI